VLVRPVAPSVAPSERGPWPPGSPATDRPFFRPDISQVVTDRASFVRCRWPLPFAAGRCCCCHRCCQLAADRPVASQPAPCRGWPASGPGRLRPGPCLLTGVSAETRSRIKRDFACTFTRHFPAVLVALRSQSCLRLEGRARTLSGPSLALSPARTHGSSAWREDLRRGRSPAAGRRAARTCRSPAGQSKRRRPRPAPGAHPVIPTDPRRPAHGGPACGGRASQGRARRSRRASGAAGAALD